MLLFPGTPDPYQPESISDTKVMTNLAYFHPKCHRNFKHYNFFNRKHLPGYFMAFIHINLND